jgi:hypothetical protein
MHILEILVDGDYTKNGTSIVPFFIKMFTRKRRVVAANEIL